MPQTQLSVDEVAASLHVSTREVVRMAEKRILPAVKSRGGWKFRANEVWDWIEKNFHGLPERREKDVHAESPGDLLLATSLQPDGVSVGSASKTKASILRELAELAAVVDPFVDAASLADALDRREAESPTALQDGVAVPHPAGPVYSEGPIVTAARTLQPIGFGERGGGLTDLFFLICCPQQTQHLLYLGRLCRLLIDKELQQVLRGAEDSASFVDAIRSAEEELCGLATE